MHRQVENMALDGKPELNRIPRNPENGIGTPKTGFLEVRKVRMAGAKMDLSTLVFSPKHMFTYRHFAFDGRTALGP